MPTLITLLVSQLKIGRTFIDFLSIEQIDFCCNRYTSSTLICYKHLKGNASKPKHLQLDKIYSIGCVTDF